MMLLFNLKFGQIGGVMAAFGFSVYGFFIESADDQGSA